MMPVIGDTSFAGFLFGNHHQRRVRLGKRGQNKRFGFLVCSGHRRRVAFLVDVEIAFVDLHDHRACLEGDPGKRVSSDGHSVSPGWIGA